MVELIIALALLAMSIAAAGALATAAARAGNEAGRRSQATALATRELEALKNHRDSLAKQDNRWTDVFDPAGIDRCARPFAMRRAEPPTAPTGWTAVDAPLAYSDLDEPGYSQYALFTRQISICPENAQDFKTVEVRVTWEEASGPTRSLIFRSVIGNWIP